MRKGESHTAGGVDGGGDVAVVRRRGIKEVKEVAWMAAATLLLTVGEAIRLILFQMMPGLAVV